MKLKIARFLFPAGQSWHRLPSVSPQQISISRLIKKLVTGRLDAEVRQFSFQVVFTLQLSSLV